MDEKTLNDKLSDLPEDIQEYIAGITAKNEEQTEANQQMQERIDKLVEEQKQRDAEIKQTLMEQGDFRQLHNESSAQAERYKTQNANLQKRNDALEKSIKAFTKEQMQNLPESLHKIVEQFPPEIAVLGVPAIRDAVNKRTPSNLPDNGAGLPTGGVPSGKRHKISQDQEDYLRASGRSRDAYVKGLDIMQKEII